MKKSPSKVLFYIFAWGTTRIGEPSYNHFLNYKNGVYKYICKGEMMEKHPMVIATKFNIPMMLYKPGVGHFIQGDIFQVNEDTGEEMDRFYETPKLFVKDQMMVANITTGVPRCYKCWVYFLKRYNRHLLKLYLHRNYHSKSWHGYEFVPPESREDDEYDFRKELKENIKVHGQRRIEH